MSVTRHVSIIAVLWLVSSVLGIAFSLSIGMLPSPASHEAHVVDSAMTLLTVLAVPVFTLVVIMLGYSMLVFRQRGDVLEDGPSIAGNQRIELLWVGVTLALTIFLAGYGTYELLGLRTHAAQSEESLLVKVTGSQWLWEFYYPKQNIRTFAQLTVPLGRTVQFEVTSKDIVHSFWIPAFRMKIDAVPGLTTRTFSTPDRVGSFIDDPNFRVQCAELCGLAHSAMFGMVTVMDPKDFDAWAASQPTAQ